MAKVAIIIDSLGAGGAQKQACLLASRFANLRNASAFILHYVEDVHHSHGGAKRLGPGRWGKVRVLARALTLLRLLLLCPDVVISFLRGPSRIAMVYKRMRPGVTWVMSERNSGEELDDAVAARSRAMFRVCDAIVANSRRRQLEVLAECPGVAHKCCVIPNWSDGVGIGFDLSAPRLAAVYAVGRLVHNKGPDILIEACRICAAEGISLDVLWFGDDLSAAMQGHREVLHAQTLRALAAKSNVRVQFMGRTANPLLRARVGEIFVLPSRNEGLPNVVIEAMLCGMVVVASDVGDVGTLVVNGQTGILCEPTAAAIAKGLADAYKMPVDARVRMGFEARRRVAEVLDEERLLQLWLAVARMPTL